MAEQCSLPLLVQSREPTHWSMKIRLGVSPSDGRLSSPSVGPEADSSRASWLCVRTFLKRP